jgi:hypothetical protein
MGKSSIGPSSRSSGATGRRQAAAARAPCPGRGRHSGASRPGGGVWAWFFGSARGSPRRRVTPSDRLEPVEAHQRTGHQHQGEPVGCGNSDVAYELRIRRDRSLDTVTLLSPSPRHRGHPVLPKLAYFTLCRSIQLLALLGRSGAAKDWRSSSCATSSLCCVASSHVPGWSLPTGPCSLPSVACCRDRAGRASSSGRRRCCVGTAVWSPAPGPTRIVDQAAPHSTRTSNS